MTDYLKILKQAGKTANDVSSRQFATMAGIGKTRAAEVLKSLRSSPVNTGMVNKSQIETREIVGDRMNIGIPSTRICTLEQLIEHCQIDMTQWTVKSFVANKWEGYTSDGEGGLNVEPLFQIKATFERAKGLTVEAVKAEVADLKAQAKSSIRIPKITFPKDKNGNCLEIAIYDAHIGKLAWGEETLWADYDLQISVTEYDKAVDALISRCGNGLEEIVYVVGNDLLQADDIQGRTTKGTYVETDSRFHKVFKRARITVQRQIDKMRQIAPVKVIVVPGNHDRLSTWHLGDSLECYYGNDKHVEVFNDPAPRKYYQWGVNGIMFCHGDGGKHANYPLLMATERPDLWAATKFHEVHTGHFHKLDVKETMGTRVRIIPALCPADSWHSENNYVGSVRAAQGFIWNKEDGLIGTSEYSIKE